jgi:assimilatory nitrate reductase catalytic subunit
LKTANIDYNGRLCMVSAGAASKKVFGIDRSANPWSDITKAQVILAAGANIAECAPITTDYLWQSPGQSTPGAGPPPGVYGSSR